MAYLAPDPKKVHRSREKVMKTIKQQEINKLNEGDIIGIGYDGRKDSTKVLKKDSSGQLHPTVVKEEHVSVTWEPSGRYLTHFTPDAAVHPEKPAKKVADALNDILDKHGAKETVCVVCGDSTISNTGWQGGTHAHLERQLGQRVVWVICMKHTNELKLR